MFLSKEFIIYLERKIYISHQVVQAFSAKIDSMNSLTKSHLTRVWMHSDATLVE